MFHLVVDSEHDHMQRSRTKYLSKMPGHGPNGEASAQRWKFFNLQHVITQQQKLTSNTENKNRPQQPSLGKRMPNSNVSSIDAAYCSRGGALTLRLTELWTMNKADCSLPYYCHTCA
eukprot:TRINITY_DN56442_c0_g1_i1.p2 TRINITY_DN56442_c0_g1~~TRINITY_DN56442_c0_g1_i1.p2  ORF type:complete len:117 (-),score=5.06 TRINITY_DN56442_c0_g1_i1:620-970(-)